MVQPAPIELLASRGFQVGPGPDTACEKCGHRWGGHLLHPTFEQPMNGGTWSCPEHDCRCFGTWDVVVPDSMRPMHQRLQDERALDEPDSDGPPAEG